VSRRSSLILWLIIYFGWAEDNAKNRLSDDRLPNQHCRAISLDSTAARVTIIRMNGIQLTKNNSTMKDERMAAIRKNHEKDLETNQETG